MVSSRKRKWVTAITITATLACGLWLFNGCNVFSPLAADSQKDLTYQGLILRGNDAINNKDYAAAESYFADAMLMNHKGSEAFLYRSKALMSKHKIDYNTLNIEFNSRRNKDGKGKKGVPFIDSNTTLFSIDSIYYPVAQSVENLEHIIRKSNDSIKLENGYALPPDGDTASDGRISEGVARLDLGLLEAVKGMLGPLDLDGDNHISSSCGKNICPDLNPICKATSAYKSKCKDGENSEIISFENFKQLTRSLDINNISSKDVRARNVSSNPNDINSFLDKMEKPIAGSNFNLDSVTGAMDQHNESKLSGNLTEIVTNIKDLSFFLAYMHYNDGKDNDFDVSSSTGTGSPMIWHDYDREHGIHWNYDEDSTLFLSYLTGSRGEAVNAGHPIHRYVHPDLYVKFSESEWKKRAVSADTSKNSRANLMRKHCRVVVDSLIEGGIITAAFKLNLSSTICDSFSTIIKPGTTHPNRSDWIDGTYGIDEEMVDEHDNDYDGIQDEDARNAKGMDDDDDAMINVSMIGTMPARMFWNDATGHLNACPDIDTDIPMAAAPLQKQNCIGALENRILLAMQAVAGKTFATSSDTINVASDTLDAYYSPFTDEGANKNCLDDFNKLPNDYKLAIGISSNRNAIIKSACHFKHIWIKGMPPRSEWTSGVLGIDEEIPDGVDNDGDGWTDEDVK